MQPGDTRRAIDAVVRIEMPRLIAGLTRMVRDVGLAEELAQDAVVTALEKWPEIGVPENPGAWLMATAKNRGIDALRRGKRVRRKHEELGHESELGAAGGEGSPERIEAAADDEVGDELLSLVFIACHPCLSTEARVALTLRLLGGLTTEEIARAFLTSEATIAQRIVRAKKTLAEAGAAFEVPRGEALRERVESVLEVLYLVFNEGYAATAGDDWMRPALCDEALRMGRVLAALAPSEPEVHGLVALMEIQASRMRARVGPDGEPVLLLDQNRAKWDWVLIGHGLGALERGMRAAGEGTQSGGPGAGNYLLQAAIAACHARARSPEQTDWARIAGLYAVLAQRAPSPVVELNRAVAVGMAEGPARGLAIVDALAQGGALAGYHLLPSVRADLLAKLGRFDEAARECDRAAALTKNEREKKLLAERAARWR